VTTPLTLFNDSTDEMTDEAALVFHILRAEIICYKAEHQPDLDLVGKNKGV